MSTVVTSIPVTSVRFTAHPALAFVRAALLAAILSAQVLRTDCNDALNVARGATRRGEADLAKASYARHATNANLLQVGRSERRALNLTYGMLRGQPYRKIEPMCEPRFKPTGATILSNMGLSCQDDTALPTGEAIDAWMAQGADSLGRALLGTMVEA